MMWFHLAEVRKQQQPVSYFYIMNRQNKMRLSPNDTTHKTHFKVKSFDKYIGKLILKGKNIMFALQYKNLI
jgi:hypothetical protein